MESKSPQVQPSSREITIEVCFNEDPCTGLTTEGIE